MTQGFTARDLERLLSDIDRQPDWRTEASKCVAYYDGNQLSQEMIETLKARGQPVLVNNLIGPVVDGILGMEAKSRQGFRVRADNDHNLLVAEALNEEINEMARMTGIDNARSDAFASQVKAGLGWVELNMSSDPFEYGYQASHVHRNEIWWDWSAKRPDLSDARWLLRRRWLDEDEAIAFFPQHRELIKQAANGWSNFMEAIEEQARPTLYSAYQEYADYGWNDDQLFDTDRKRVRIHEVYYRVFERGLVMTSPDGRVVRFDKDNPLHQTLAASGQVSLHNRPYKRMYQAWYIGPHRVWNGPSPHPHNRFPYVPFWGLREDESGVPYGLIRRMISPQDEVNFRRSKLTYLLNNKRVIKDSDAVMMSDQDLLDEINRADGVITLNPDRKNLDSRGFWVETENGIASQQFQIMQEAKQQIQDCAGVYSAMLGQENNASSGVALNGLIEQGATTLAEILDNYRYASRSLGELMLAYKVREIGHQPRKVVVNANKPEPTREVLLNQVSHDAQGREVVNNDVMRTKAQVVLDDIVNTPGYRAQMTQRLMELVQALPANIQASVIDLVIMSTDVPNKEEILKRVRRATGQGVNPDDLSDEERAQQQQQQQQKQQQEQLQQAQQQLMLQEVSGKIAALEAEAQRSLAAAQKDQATAQSIAVNDDLVEVQTLKALADLRNFTDKIQSDQLMAGPAKPPSGQEPPRPDAAS